MRLYLVRHAAVVLRPEQPSSQWHLSPDGRAAADALAKGAYWQSLTQLHTSSEPKAVATAQRIASAHGLAIRIDHDLREVARPYVSGDYEDAVRRYFAGEALEGWEPRDDALVRTRTAIEGIVARGEDAAVVSHGLALTLYLGDLLDLDAEGSFDSWRRIRFPDVAAVDPAARRLEREFGT